MISGLRSCFLMRRADRLPRAQDETHAVSKELLERNLFLTGQIAAQQVRQIERVRTLADVEFRVTSQSGEDGIIDWLCHKLPDINHTFIEFGVESFAEANTRFLLENRSWRGLVLDGSATNVAKIQSGRLYWTNDLVTKCAFVTAENINDLIAGEGFSGDLGILSIDIDGNDYWVLNAIDCVKPAILITEINSVLGDLHAIVVPYDPAFERFKAHYSGQYFGASLKAMIGLAQRKGFRFVGTTSNGVNAFFVRSDLAENVLVSIDTVTAWPARHRDSRDAAGNLTFVRGAAKAELIAQLPIHDLERKVTVPLERLFPLYSESWQRRI